MIDLDLVVHECCCMLRPMAAERAIAMACRAEPVQVLGDRNRLADAVVNLLSNAIRYNRDGGRVDISLARDGNHAALEVRDTGPGIAEADRPHVFERFYRADKARASATRGSGLGLAITHGIVKAHGGTISFSCGEGEGTVFRIVLDVQRDALSRQDLPPTPESFQSNATAPTSAVRD